MICVGLIGLAPANASPSQSTRVHTSRHSSPVNVQPEDQDASSFNCLPPSPPPSIEPSPTPTDSPPPTDTPVPTNSPSASDQPSPGPSDTPAPSPGPSDMPGPSASPTPVPTPTPSPTPKPTPTPTQRRGRRTRRLRRRGSRRRRSSATCRTGIWARTIDYGAITTVAYFGLRLARTVISFGATRAAIRPSIRAGWETRSRRPSSRHTPAGTGSSSPSRAWPGTAAAQPTCARCSTAPRAGVTGRGHRRRDPLARRRRRQPGLRAHPVRPARQLRGIAQ